MTLAAKRVQSTPMAPYFSVLQGLNISDKQIIIEYLLESVSEAEEANRKAEDEFLARKMAEIEVSPRIKDLIEQTRLTAEEAADERTRYILGLDRR